MFQQTDHRYDGDDAQGKEEEVIFLPKKFEVVFIRFNDLARYFS